MNCAASEMGKLNTTSPSNCFMVEGTTASQTAGLAAVVTSNCQFIKPVKKLQDRGVQASMVSIRAPRLLTGRPRPLQSVRSQGFYSQFPRILRIPVGGDADMCLAARSCS